MEQVAEVAKATTAQTTECNHTVVVALIKK